MRVATVSVGFSLLLGPIVGGCGTSKPGTPCEACTAGQDATPSGTGGAAPFGQDAGMGGVAGPSVDPGHPGSTAGSAQTAGGATGTRPENAGAGGLGGAGGSVRPTRLAAAHDVTDIAVKDGFVYYGDSDADASGDTYGHLSRVSVGGGVASTLAHATPSGVPGKLATFIPLAIVVHGASVYLTETRIFAPSRVAKVSIVGGDPVDVWSDAECSQILPPLALDGDQLYWFAGCVGASGTLLTMATTGGNATVLASGNGEAWLKPGSAWTPDCDNRALTVANGFAFWAVSSGQVLSLPLSGGDTPRPIAYGFVVSGPSAVAFSGDRLFFTINDYVLQGKGSLVSVVPGESTTNVLAGSQKLEEYSALAVDETSVYWGVDDSIKKAPRDGGVAITLVSSLSNPRSFALDDNSIFWTDDSGGVWRAPKR